VLFEEKAQEEKIKKIKRKILQMTQRNVLQ